MNISFVIMSAAFCIISTIFLSLALHEYVHVLQLRPNKASEIVILGRKNNKWGGRVTGPFNLTNKSERHQELEAYIIEYIFMYIIQILYFVMLLKEWVACPI